MTAFTETNTFPHLNEHDLDLLLREARTHYFFLPTPVAEETLRKVYDLMKWGPTSANSCPLRIVFLTTEEAKARVLPALSANNVEKSQSAPVVALIAYDMEFYEQLPKLFLQADARSWFVGKPEMIAEAAFRNGSLQGGYFILAARALGLDCGPMSGFDQDKVNAEFFPDGKWKINFVCNLGHGDPAKVYPRNPRLDFDEACKVL